MASTCDIFRPARALGAALALLGAACRSSAPVPAVALPTPVPPATVPASVPAPGNTVGMTSLSIIPAPVSLVRDSGAPFILAQTSRVAVSGGDDAARIAELFAAWLRPSTGFPLAVTTGAPARGDLSLVLDAGRAPLGDEGYELTVTSDAVRLVAFRPAGLFRATQTLRQLLPASAESEMKVARAVWTVPAVTIADRPRFAWRGAMLDVARHFFTVREVEQFIDILALYKLNVLHLHLSDDQGWRIEIASRPRLTALGGATQVGGGPGGFYTQQDYTRIVAYAAARHVTVVPEIDMPGHSNAALVAYPELSCSKRPTALFTGTDVGWSTFCVDNEATYALIDDVVREIAAITPGPWFHVGGDEVEALTHEQYARFVGRVQDIVGRHGKRMIGWEEVATAPLRASTLIQQWRNDSVGGALQYGGKLILSPAKRTYLDMKYTATTELGLRWAGLVDVRDAYEWDPATYLKHVAERDIVGIEAPIWSETLSNIGAVQYMAMPRLPALAEVGWTPQATRRWDDVRTRLAAHAQRWRYMGVNYHRSEQIDW